ncbi:MAG: Serine/threonine protein kinase [Candidatus Roizmanbacteria bacterium GW2011_GWC2_34_23]|uniref:Serine/threonine protein kinase n=1 Tax=Candidatus Roizmanbacteria bacterium GW2011_GWC2_34_23 TaxID=1618484 RepID=A0A0G0AXX0_9BACT|nr:MAG: Serine/threonine protein kinase [Candidatus Roizmanbacteria bacterium GW2011_GWC2_34_23]
MKVRNFIIVSLIIIFSLFSFNSIFAEDKNTPSGMIPKLPKTQNDPQLLEGHVYPSWGPVCQRYTYSVIYFDKEGRKPEYVKIYFNGQMINMQKANPKDNDYKKGVKYFYKYVPNKLGSNFYYFEASNGLGKTRDAIIDSPDNGPVLFKSAFEKNEIAVISKQSGKKILSFSTGKEWVGGISLSDNGKYLAAKTSKHVYLFDTEKPKEPLWSFACEQCRIGDDVKGGVAISGDGSKIIAAFGEKVTLFDKSSKKPIWMYTAQNSSYNVAISKDGKYMAAATAGEESDKNSNLLILWNDKNEKPLWSYHSSGNFHDVSLSSDGSFITGSTGCPDRRFYLFSKDSNKPLIKSDPLTRDSPVHRAKNSADGSLMAVGSESDAGAVFLFKANSKEPVWKFPTQNGSSVRALNFTPDGKFIGAATFGGQAYIFDSKSSQPITSWTVNTTLGGIDIADDGSFIAAGGTDNKLYIFDRGKKTGIEVPFNEYLEEIDISANGKYIAAGTGGSVYFFETYISQDRGKTFNCSSIIEPSPESQLMANFGVVDQGGRKPSLLEIILNFIKNIFKLEKTAPSGKAVCGNDFCEPNLNESKQSCPQDCSAQ